MNPAHLTTLNPAHIKKITLTFILSLFSLFVMGQENTIKEFKYIDNDGTTHSLIIPFIDDDVVFSKVYQLDSMTSQDIYARGKIAIVDMFRSAKSVTQLEDADNKILIIKGTSPWIKNSDAMMTQGFDVHFSLRFECKDSKYKVSLYGLYSENSANTIYGPISITAHPSDCLKHGIKKNGTIRSNIYGLSFLAWSEIATEIFTKLNKHIVSATLNASDDW